MINSHIAAAARDNVLSIVGQGRVPERALEIPLSAFFLADHLTRRFEAEDIVTLMEAVNTTRRRVWRKRARGRLKQAWIDIDGTLAETHGQCKQGMDISRKGIWGYHPLHISLANTKEVLMPFSSSS